MLRSYLLIFLMILAAPLAAQDSEAFLFGDDAYLAGQTVKHTGDAVDDLFAAGDNVSALAPVVGSAHMLGRYVTISERVGNSLYAVGMNVDVAAPVGGDATLMGETITVSAAIGGDLRVAGQTIEISGSVAEAALIAGETVVINQIISGDVSLAAENVEFGDGALIEGKLHLYHNDPESIDVPASVVSSDRIEFHPVEDWDGVGMGDVARVTWWAIAKRMIVGIAVVTLAAIAVSALAPEFIAGMRRQALATPARSIWMGFLALSATIGSLVLFAMTGIGLLLVPVSIFAALALGFAGYVIGVYILGVGLTGMIGRAMPETLGDRAIAALVGAVAATLIALIPFLGWLFVLGLVLMGAGALIVRFFAPGFYTNRVTY